MRAATTNALIRGARALDARLMAASVRTRRLAILATLCVMAAIAIPNVPRPYVDYSRLPILNGIEQFETYGTDTIADMYESKVILNDPGDMYTKRGVEQTPLEAQTWSKEASAPYPPAVLLAEAALYVIGERTGIGFYGMILLVAAAFIGLSAVYCLRTRWYVFPLLYLNFFYFGHRFVYVQDGSYLLMLLVIMTALFLARTGSHASHALMALAITMKLSPLYYVRYIAGMTRSMAVLFIGILTLGLIAPFFIWENYAYIFRFNEGVKADVYQTTGAIAAAGVFSILLWYVETRLGFDWEDRIGWSVVPFAMLLGFKMNSARHLLIVLLIPDKRGLRNVAAVAGMSLHYLLPGLIRFNSVLAITSVLLFLTLFYYLSEIGWEQVRDDVGHPVATAKLMLASPR